MKQEKTKIGFFKRLKKAIFELEDYGYFLGEKLSDAFKYFFALMFVVSVIFSLVLVYKISNLANHAYNYIVNELPNFEFKDNSLSFKDELYAYDEESKFLLLADTSENVSDEKLKEYKNKVYSKSGYGMILLKDEFIIISNGSDNVSKYSDWVMFEENNNFSITNKQDLVEAIDEINVLAIFLYVLVGMILSVFLLNVFIVLSDVCVVSIFGWFASRICGVNFKINPMIALSIYALSLSIVLDLLLDIIFILTGFVVEYFNVVYLLIAYVYIIAAIFMVKYDLIKHTEELKKIIEVQKQVERDIALGKIERPSEIENKENNDEKEEKKEEEKIDQKGNEKQEKEEPEENRDPDGSEI